MPSQFDDFWWPGQAEQGHPPAGWFDQLPVTWLQYGITEQACPGPACTRVPTAPIVLTTDLWQLTPTQGQGAWTPESAQYKNISKTSPDDRVRFVLNSGAPNGDCDAAWQLTQGIALSCLLDQDVSEDVTGVLSEPMQLNTLDDLTALSAWLKSSLRQSASTLQNAYAEHIPAMVVANATAVPGSLAASAGTAGTDVIQAANAMLDVYAKWNLVIKDADAISSAISETRDAIAIANTEKDVTSVNTSIQRLATMKAMAEDVAQIAKGISEMWVGSIASGGNPLSPVAGTADMAAGATALITDGLTMPLIDQLDMLGHQLDAEKIQQALYTLHDTAEADATDMSNALIAARQDVNNVTAGAQAFATDKSKAQYYAGKAYGANVWKCSTTNGDATECSSHVNTVLNRRYQGTALRYQHALTEARALSYMARRAIEQRIGIRLSDISSRIGPLDPPSTWADEICHLAGIDYSKLSSFGLDAGAAAQNDINTQVAQQFADAFVGDYVQKLTDFVQYYNVTYPEADGDDQAVLSLRETLLGGKLSCLANSPNLLINASRLFEVGLDPTAMLSGWVQSPCGTSDPTCLQVTRGSGPLPANAGPGSVTWLSDQPPAVQPDAGGSFDGSVPDGSPTFLPSGAPDNLVSQAIQLNAPGTYVLSWWDQARDIVTGQPSTTAIPYRVVVYDSTWTSVAGFSGPPTPSATAGTTWSTRHAVAFTVTNPDLFHIAFAASTAGGAAGSVAIANPQLELAASGATASPFVDTSPTGQAITFGCSLSPAELRQAFQRSCDADGTCHYDLQIPVTINTQTLTSNGASLAGKLAKGNYNFRHVDVALNAVGTGVLDCSQSGSPDCQGSGFLAYDLTDDGSNIGVLGADREYRRFDFGAATINQGKLLTAERYLTSPLGSEDQQLINQFLKTELRGRPIDGTYYLRIYDSPALHFDQLQDIQFVLKYHYWSRIAAPQNAN
jgi:hypothetical protein